tara:strand:- start:621 stop:1631 length:1011 start_codon:yes stop_codon:yes gene_type:complete
MEIEIMSIEKLKVDKGNIRTKIDPKEISRLADNIKEVGILEPLKIDHDNVITNGHRRYFAAKSIGLKDLPVIRKETSAKQKKIEQISHDFMNLPLSPYEKAKAIYDLKNLGLTKKEICKKFSLTPTWVEDIFLVLSDKNSVELAKSGKVDFFKISESVKGLDKKDAEKMLDAVKKNPDLTVHKDIRPMREVMKNKEINDEVKDAVLGGNVSVEDAIKLKGLNQEKQKVGVAAIKKMTEQIKTVPKILEEGEVKTERDDKKLLVNQFVERLKDEILSTRSKMFSIEGVLDQIEEEKLDNKYFNAQMKSSLRETLLEFKKNIPPVLKRIENTINKWGK